MCHLGGSFAWVKGEDEKFKEVLKDINLTFGNELVAIIGEVGAGKSSLLSALLGEMHKVSIFFFFSFLTVSVLNLFFPPRPSENKCFFWFSRVKTNPFFFAFTGELFFPVHPLKANIFTCENKSFSFFFSKMKNSFFFVIFMIDIFFFRPKER